MSEPDLIQLQREFLRTSRQAGAQLAEARKAREEAEAVLVQADLQHLLEDHTQPAPPTASPEVKPTQQLVYSVSAATEAATDIQAGIEALQQLREERARFYRRLAIISVTVFLLVFSSGIALVWWGVQPCRWLDSLRGHPSGCLRVLRSNASGIDRWVYTVTFSPDGQLIASGGEDDRVSLWEIASGRELHTLSGHTDSIHAVAFSPDGRILASESRDSRVNLWEVTRGIRLHTLSGKGAVFSPDGQTLASIVDKTVKLWDVASGRELHTLSGHTDWVHDIAFSPDGKILASTSADKTVRLWDVTSGRKVRTLYGHTEPVGGVVFSPDGQMLASASDDKTVKLWDVTSGREVRTLRGHTDRVGDVAFSPDGQTLVSWNVFGAKLWEVASGRELRTFSEYRGSLQTVIFSPDGQTLVLLGSQDHTVSLWSLTSGQKMRTLKGHTDAVFDVAFSPDGQNLVSGSRDGTVRLWEAK